MKCWRGMLGSFLTYIWHDKRLDNKSMKRRILLILMLLGVQSYGQLIHDDSYIDRDFWIFKSKLLSCVLDKDTIRLKEMLADRIFESKDGCGYCTKDAFMRYLFGEGSGEDSWNSIQKILRFGFSRLE